MPAKMTVHTVPENSVILLTGLDFGPEDMNTPIDRCSPRDEIFDAIKLVAGHDKFVIIFGTPGADETLEVWGPDTDLKAKVEKLLAESSIRRGVAEAERGDLHYLGSFARFVDDSAE